MEEYEIRFLNNECSVDVFNPLGQSLSRGYVVAVESNGLLLDFLQENGVRELVPFERLSVRLPQELKLSQGATVEVLTRELGTLKLTWKTGKVFYTCYSYTIVMVNGRIEVHRGGGGDGFIRAQDKTTDIPVTPNTFQSFRLTRPKPLFKKQEPLDARTCRQKSEFILTDLNDGVHGLIPWTKLHRAGTESALESIRECLFVRADPREWRYEDQPWNVKPVYLDSGFTAASDFFRVASGFNLKQEKPTGGAKTALTTGNAEMPHGGSFVELLPADLLVTIFKYCDIYDQRRWKRVCSSWTEILRGHSAWNKAIIKPCITRTTCRSVYREMTFLQDHLCLAHAFHARLRTLIFVGQGLSCLYGEVLETGTLLDYLKTPENPVRNLVFAGFRLNLRHLAKYLAGDFAGRKLVLQIRDLVVAAETLNPWARIARESFQIGDAAETNAISHLAMVLCNAFLETGFQDQRPCSETETVGRVWDALESCFGDLLPRELRHSLRK